VPTVLQRVRIGVVRDHDVSRLTRTNILGARHGLRVRPAYRGHIAPAPLRGDISEIVSLPARLIAARWRPRALHLDGPHAAAVPPSPLTRRAISS
jgi:hypothetical protein